MYVLCTPLLSKYYRPIINNSNCILAGSLALLVHSEDSDFARLQSGLHGRVIVLDERVSIYGLQSYSGLPEELINARKMCATRDNNTSLNLPTAG